MQRKTGAESRKVLLCTRPTCPTLSSDTHSVDQRSAQWMQDTISTATDDDELSHHHHHLSLSLPRILNVSRRRPPSSHSPPHRVSVRHSPTELVLALALAPARDNVLVLLLHHDSDSRQHRSVRGREQSACRPH
ncbi:hypothetical protein PINS_up006503 [Pythium insidiosum]|nr:hypothetical protein PINS_up006503 [Pythium insidiosum]